MPLHPATFVLGTMAVLGSGYAFKKFIYDPHLAPYIEAFLASHQIASISSNSSRQPQGNDPRRRPIAVPISARSSALKSPPGTLRRRSTTRKASVDSYELRENLLAHAAPLGSTDDVFENEDKESEGRKGSEESFSLNDADENTFRRVRKLDLEGNYKSDESSRSTSGLSSRDADSEVRDVVFNYPRTNPSSPSSGSPRLLRTSTTGIKRSAAAPLAVNPFTTFAVPDISISPIRAFQPLIAPGSARESNSEPRTPVPSGTFSILSLHPDQLHSPEAPTSMLDSMMSASWTSAGVPPSIRSRTGLEDDVVSLPDTVNGSTSGYEDAETYSPQLTGNSILQGSIPAFPRQQQPGLSPEARAARSGGLGLSANESTQHVSAEDFGLAWPASPTRSVRALGGLGYTSPGNGDAQELRRGPMSVISLSESEDGWRSGEDWEITSERSI